jgi:RNA polymerase sigma-70 factor (ECF subfamily)
MSMTMKSDAEYDEASWPTGEDGREHLARLADLAQQRLQPLMWTALRDSHAVEDVLQETLLALVERMHSVRRHDRLWPWLYRVAWNKVRDHFRQGRRCGQARALSARHFVRPGWPSGIGPSVIHQIIGREDVEELGVAVQRLSPRSRAVVFLRVCEQMPYGEIATLMHSTPGQVRVQFHRATRRLRRWLTVSYE